MVDFLSACKFRCMVTVVYKTHFNTENIIIIIIIIIPDRKSSESLHRRESTHERFHTIHICKRRPNYITSLFNSISLLPTCNGCLSISIYLYFFAAFSYITCRLYN